jgi:DivIVA domain-containing protein
MAFMPEDVLNKNFTATQFRRGYDEHEVDDFLDEIVIELRRLSAENDDLNKQLTTCLEDKGVIAPDAKDKIAAARASADQAEKDAATRIAKAKVDAEAAESRAAQRKKVADEAVYEVAKSAVAAPEPAKEVARGATGVGAAGAAGIGSAAGVLALAEKLHAEYVTEGQETRERLIGEGQAHRDKVIGEATAKQAELRSTAQAKHDALISEATTRHEQLITEARERATGMVAEAQQKKAELLQSLGHERSLLQRKIDELRIFERDYRARLKSHLEGQLHQLEEAGSDETAADQR